LRKFRQIKRLILCNHLGWKTGWCSSRLSDDFRAH